MFKQIIYKIEKKVYRAILSRLKHIEEEYVQNLINRAIKAAQENIEVRVTENAKLILRRDSENGKLIPDHMEGDPFDSKVKIIFKNVKS